MDVCLIECQNAINIFVAMMIYLGVLVLVIFGWNRFAVQKARYGGRELDLLTHWVSPLLIFLKMGWGISFRLDALGVLAFIGGLGLLRCRFLRKGKREKLRGLADATMPPVNSRRTD